MSAEKCCPQCEGGSGYSYYMTEIHLMSAAWGDHAEAEDSGLGVRASLVTCDECGARFRLESLKEKGLAK